MAQYTQRELLAEVRGWIEEAQVIAEGIRSHDCDVETRVAFSRSYKRIGTIVSAIPASAITARWADYQGEDGIHGDAVWFGSR